MSDITLTVEEESADLLMTITPAEGQPKVNVKKMEKAFKSSPYSTFLLIDGALELLFEAVNKADDNDEGKDNSAVFAIIANAVDSTAKVSLSPDNMSATLEITAGYGGKQFNNSSVVELLKEHNVTKGISKENLVNIVQQSLLLKGGKSISTEIALGKNSVNGENGYIKYLVGDPVDRILRPKRLENGKVDMRELGDLVVVKKGRKLARLIPPTDGQEGFNVIGDIVEATRGDAVCLEETEGSSFLNENKNIIISTTDGMPKHLDNSVAVHKVLEIENIDVGTGNIRFDGSIYVKGNVCEGMELFASEDIVIGGIVESAMITSGGSISIAQGVIGKKVSENDENENSTMLQAQGDINAQFVQYTDIFAKNDIKITQYISHSQIIVEGDLWVGNIEKDKADGKIFGSLVQSGGSINVGTLGSTSGARTTLDFSYWANTVEDLRIDADEQSTKIIRRLPKIYKLLAKAVKQEDNNPTKIERIKKALQQHLHILGKLDKEWLEKEDKISDHLETLELCVYQSILSGVDVTISSKTCAFKRDYDATKLQWLENDISVEPIVT
ncbi:DUF342 domain-containing protein [Colwellia sp. 12G3]|uniref:DUF342 domain-containing protein n=1 Tax=Colwellia sp. 12G3 TaxID=2058299 RepID=UPI000C32F9ED|nr:FapA family protein [Colwellia sp. 12G3]PKI18176.1 hypothetical protein CXF71_00150 [Colwellia sp. 12G3]